LIRAAKPPYISENDKLSDEILPKKRVISKNFWETISVVGDYIDEPDYDIYYFYFKMLMLFLYFGIVDMHGFKKRQIKKYIKSLA
jgi:hypothetical protein